MVRVCRTEVDAYPHQLAAVLLVGYQIILAFNSVPVPLGRFIQFQFHHIEVVSVSALHLCGQVVVQTSTSMNLVSIFSTT